MLLWSILWCMRGVSVCALSCEWNQLIFSSESVVLRQVLGGWKIFGYGMWPYGADI